MVKEKEKESLARGAETTSFEEAAKWSAAGAHPVSITSAVPGSVRGGKRVVFRETREEVDRLVAAKEGRA